MSWPYLRESGQSKGCARIFTVTVTETFAEDTVISKSLAAKANKLLQFQPYKTSLKNYS
jgi:hypothetical protein